MTRQTLADFTGQTELPCPKALKASEEDPKQPAPLDETAETPCCFDCDERDACGHMDARYPAPPCINSVCPFLRPSEFRLITHCRTTYLYQTLNGVAGDAGKAVKFCRGVNQMIGDMIEENKRRQMIEEARRSHKTQAPT